MIRGLFQYRGYIVENAWAIFRYRYAGASLSVFWNVAQPLAMLVIYFTVFSLIFASKLEAATGAVVDASVLFVLYLCAGFLPWFAMNECVSYGTRAFVNNASYLKRLPIPEQVFVAKEALVASFNLVISFFLLVAISALFGHYPSMIWILLPAPLMLLLSFAFGLSLCFSVLNVFFRDVGEALPVLLHIWFWLTPIVYPLSILPSWLGELMYLNPVYIYLVAIRDIFLDHTMPSAMTWGLMLFWTAVALVIGFITLRTLRTEIRDCL